MLGDLLQDLRYGFRTLARSPTFTVVAVTTLALGIGANATVFTIANSVLLRHPPLVAAPDELVRFTLVHERGKVSDAMTYPDYEYYRENNRVFSGVLAYGYSRTALAVSDGDRTVTARAGFISANYFDVLGVSMALGRSFLASENETPGTHPVIILENGFWKRYFGSDPGAVGRRLILNGNAFTVVGVAPEGFRGVSPVEEPPDIFLPAMMRGFGLQRIDGQFSYSWNLVGRLRSGVDIDEAQANIDLLQARWKDEFAAWIEASAPPVYRITLTSRFQLAPGVGNNLDRLLTVLFMIVGAVLLIGCANIAILLVARASGRQKEIGIRIALGAGRGRLMRQLLTESLLLALAGGAVGWLVAAWGAGLAAALIPFSFSVDIGPDASVAIFILAVSAGAVLLFGLAPAWQPRRSDILSFLSREEQSRERLTIRNILVVAQLAMSIVLMLVSGLFIRSLITARSVDLGFVPERKLVATPAISNAGYSEDEGRQFVREMFDRMAELPGVVGVSTTMIAPFQSRETHPIQAGTGSAGGGYEAGFNRVGPGYFQLMGIPVVAGREFERSDDRTASPSVVVNQELAERMWPGQDPLGKFLVFGDRRWVVIGVVRNALYYEVGEAPQTQFYVSQLQDYSPIVTFVVATAGRAQTAARSVEDAIRGYDPALPIHMIAELEDFVDDELSEYRVLAILSALFGGLAILLSAVGLYGVQSYVVSRRRREIGIRLAMGALEGQVVRAVIGRAVRFAVIGILLGVGASLAVAQLIEGMLFGVDARDPVTYVAVPLFLLSVACVASLVPAVRAGKVDPVEVLREE